MRNVWKIEERREEDSIQIHAEMWKNYSQKYEEEK